MWVRFAARRLAMLLLTLFVASFTIFGAMFVAPGNPVSALTGGRSISPEALDALESRYNLDEPFLVQYWRWLTNAIQGDLGTSIAMRQDVSELIVQRGWITLALVLYASVLIVVVGIGLGVLSGLRPGWLDTSVVAITAMTAAIPSFVAAIVLTLVFAVTLGWFPAIGIGDGFTGTLKSLTLPAISLAMSAFAIVARVTRSAIREESGRDHVQTAASRGIPGRLVTRRHVLRNAAIPITTTTGITIASLIAVSSVVETAFGLNGLGQYLVRAAQEKDLAVVQGISLVLIVAFVSINLIVDLLYPVLDPRISLMTRPS